MAPIRRPRKEVPNRPMVLVMLDQLPAEPTTVIIRTLVGDVTVETDLVAGHTVASNGREWWAAEREYPRFLHDRALAATRIVGSL
jgi:hypothetical protein